jgi:hypothetical protein
MTNVLKKNRESEAFDIAKIIRSIRLANLDELTSYEVASKIPKRDGITTEEIRRIIIKELKRIDPEAAMRYSNTRRLAAKKAMHAVKGFAMLPRETMSRLKLRTGENIQVVLGDKRQTLKAEPGLVDRNEIQLNEEDLVSIGASDGTRIAVQRD